MKTLRIATSPLTNKIYAGTTNKTGNIWNNDKQDVTIDCLTAVVEHCLNLGSTVQLTKLDGTVDFEIDVKDLRNEQ